MSLKTNNWICSSVEGTNTRLYSACPYLKKNSLHKRKILYVHFFSSSHGEMMLREKFGPFACIYFLNANCRGLLTPVLTLRNWGCKFHLRRVIYGDLTKGVFHGDQNISWESTVREGRRPDASCVLSHPGYSSRVPASM